MQPDVELAAVSPKGTLFSRIGAYAFGMCFFGLVPVLLIIPFGLPPGHPGYLAAWAVGAVIASFFMHRVVRRTMEGSYLTLTADRLTIGKHSPTTIRLEDVVDTVPILSQHKAFQKPVAAVNSEQFTVVLLRLRDGSRLPLSALRNAQGFEAFLIQLFGLVRPTIKTQGDLSAGDIAVLGARNANKLHGPDG
jgi:hypothetical protein